VTKVQLPQKRLAWTRRTRRPPRAAIRACGLLAAACLFAACWGKGKPAETPTEKIVRGPVELKIDVRTELKAAKSRKIEVKSFPTLWGQPTKKIVKLIPEGTSVKTGDFLASLDKTEFEKTARVWQAEVAKAAADLEKAQKSLAVDASQLRATRDRLRAELEKKEIAGAICKALPGAAAVAEAEADVEKATKAEACLKADCEAVSRLFAQGCESKAKLEGSRLDHEIAKVQRETKNVQYQSALAGPEPDALAQVALDVEESRTKLAQAEAELSTKTLQLELTITQMQKQKQKQELQLQRCKQGLKDLEFFAPKAGVVVYARIWQGGGGREKVKEGMGIDTYDTLMTIEDTSAMIAEAEVEEAQISLIRAGLPATLQLDAMPGETFTASITEIGTIAHEPGEKTSGEWWQDKKEPSGVRVFEVKALLGKIDPRLRTGMSGALCIQVEEVRNVVSIPAEALFKKGDKPIVYVWRRGKARERAVVPGRAVGKRLVILKGLDEGEEICLMEPLG